MADAQLASLVGKGKQQAGTKSQGQHEESKKSNSSSSSSSNNSGSVQYKSEVFVPLSRPVVPPQSLVFHNVRDKLTERQSSWEEQVSRIRQDFFRLRTDDVAQSNQQQQRPPQMAAGEDRRVDVTTTMRRHSNESTNCFSVNFDVREFPADNISVTLSDDRRLTVDAKREVTGADGQKIVHDFKQHVDLPPSVSIERMICLLSPDGILQIRDSSALPSNPTTSWPASPTTPPSPNLPSSPNSVRCSSGGGTVTRSLAGGGGRDTDHDSRSWKFDSCALVDRAKAGSSDQDYYYTSSMTSSSRGPEGEGGSTAQGKVEYGSRSDMFELTVNIGVDYEPGDVQVKTVDRRVIIQARHEQRAEGRTSCKQFTRHFDLPSNVEPNLVTASLTDVGQLIISAPYSNTPGSGLS